MVPGRREGKEPDSRKNMSMHLLKELRNSERNHESWFQFQELGVRNLNPPDCGTAVEIMGRQ